ncbi:pentatricopeptide repeat-containing protein At5g16860-like [Selaginella moellendorffii]|uniref:pentatricopeptide repeat-containing protein At5g16860-like n=1 Tax=Selaginella moellendorffii TaxID=88036 RepID=UPI000D1C51F7|nr:pentatricopeptide repeat-containing protein At5g16860-like [Selaginella moellendorffii]|eukprot:XP_024539662.1 pentatricopeptide repeat-containing protein At5g16860-like [Selaginella moellendorffii]
MDSIQLDGDGRERDLLSSKSIGLINAVIHGRETGQARRIFDSMDRRTAASWNCVIGGYARCGHRAPVLSAAACRGVRGRRPGGFLWKVWQRALEIFLAAKLGTKDVVLWSAMISACSQGGEDELALELFELMLLEDGVEANARTLAAVLDACTNLGWLDRGGEIYSKFARTGMGISSSVFVSNMYAKWGRLLDCWSVFDGMIERDLVSWNVMIMGYAKGGEAERALELFTAMQALDVVVSSRTLAAFLQVCLDMAEKEEARKTLESGVAGEGIGFSFPAGQTIHRLIEEAGAENSPVVANSLISFYSKCGDIVESPRVFDGLDVSWSALIAGYSRQDAVFGCACGGGKPACGRGVLQDMDGFAWGLFNVVIGKVAFGALSKVDDQGDQAQTMKTMTTLK